MTDDKQTREWALKKLIRAGAGLPQAIRIYSQLTCGGFYELDKKELNTYIKENF